MNKTGLIIRLEKKDEQRTVENMVRESFWNVYRPGCFEHCLLNRMRDNKDFIQELNFVLEKDGEIIGHAAFVKSKIDLDNGEVLPSLTLGPFCIAREFKMQGYGKILLDYIFEEAKTFGSAVLFEGNINFYGKSGCLPASKFGIRYHGLPEGEDSSFFLCKLLKEGYLDRISGEYSAPDVYFISEDTVDEFDKAFPEKEKLKLPGQLF